MRMDEDGLGDGPSSACCYAVTIKSKNIGNNLMAQHHRSIKWEIVFGKGPRSPSTGSFIEKWAETIET